MAADPNDASFKSRLDERCRKIAKEELGEKNDKDRELAVQSLRQWVLQQPWLKTPTDFSFLLRFLRVRKFSQLGARQTLENYWTARSEIPQWFKGIDPADPVLLELLKTGFYFSPQSRDEKGRRLIVERPDQVNLDDVIKQHGSIDVVFKAIVLVCEWMNRDENLQTAGVVIFPDFSNVKLANLMRVWGPGNGEHIMQYLQNSLPWRIKGLHVYNEPAFIDIVYSVVSPLMKSKIKDRLIFHGNSLAKVYDHIDKTILPDEYLPDEYNGPRVGPCSKLVDAMIEDMQQPEFREYMCNLSSDKYGVDLLAKAKADVPLDSFRKLNVD